MLTLHGKERERAIGIRAPRIVVCNSTFNDSRPEFAVIVVAFRVHDVVYDIFRQVVRDFTSSRTSLTTKAAVEIYRHSVSGHLFHPLHLLDGNGAIVIRLVRRHLVVVVERKVGRVAIDEFPLLEASIAMHRPRLLPSI